MGIAVILSSVSALSHTDPDAAGECHDGNLHVLAPASTTFAVPGLLRPAR